MRRVLRLRCGGSACGWGVGPLSVLLILTSLGVSSCAGMNSTREVRTAAGVGVQAGSIEVPAQARVGCKGAPLPPPHPTIADYRTFGALQTGELGVCEARRALAVETMDLHNKANAELAKKVLPRPWWRFWGQ